MSDILPDDETKEAKLEPAKRYDKGKLRFDLLPGDGVEELVRVFTYGAQKYADRNWELGMSWSRCLASLFRHVWAFFYKHESFDEESGCHHMAHATWNALALVVYDLRKIGTDDRPN